MSDMDFYPAGAYYDSSAPYNEPYVPEKEFDCTCIQVLSKTVSVITDNYIPGKSGVDDEVDDEGHPYASPWHDPDDTSDTNWAEEYHDNDHYTPIQLIGLYKDTLKKQLESWEGMEDTPEGMKNIKNIKHLISECEGWEEDELDYEGE